MRVIAGPEKKTRVMSEKERLITAYHEVGPRDRRPPAAQLRPGPQDLDHQPRPGARLHDQPADRGQVPHHPRRADRHDGDDPRRPRRRGDRLRRDHHRRLQRPRKGDRDGEADGDALRDVRAARPARLRPRSRPALPRPRVLLRARLLRRDRPRDRRRDPPHRRERPPDRARTCSNERRDELDRISKLLLERETIDAEQFVALLEGKSADEVFADDEEPAKPAEPEPPSPSGRSASGARSRRPRPARPGLRRRRRRSSPRRTRRSVDTAWLRS